MQFSCEGFLSPTYIAAFHDKYEDLIICIYIHTVVRSKATAITDCIAVAKEKRKTARNILKEKTVMQKFFI